MGGRFEALRTEYQDVVRKSFAVNQPDLLENKVRQCTNTGFDLKTPLDQALRDHLLELLEQETGIDNLKKFVDFSVTMCRKELSTSTMPVVLLSDIFDVLTLDVCQEMFQYVEDMVEVWKEPLFFSCCKNSLLRLCNDLLRRLSRSTATVFCGRILLFLAKFFPFSERSGLNIVSEFNLDNVTEYKAESGTEDDEQHANTTEQRNEDDTATQVDFTFYCKFWSLQDFFRNPNQLYSKMQWKMFCAHATNVLNAFQSLKLENSMDYNNLSNDEYGEKIHFSKYLTSQKLLDLQLYDVNFRRAILLQFLILFQYLASNVKFKAESYELKSDQKDWIQSNTEKVYSLLGETPPDGKRFAEIISNILNREEHWNAWKNEGCPELRKNLPLSTSSEGIPPTADKPRPLLGDLIKQATEKGEYYMGSSELTKLWNYCPDNLEACKGKQRDFLPTLDEYFSEAIAQVLGQNTSNNSEQSENLFKNGNYGWRALRLLAKRSPHFFTYSTTIMDTLASYLEMMVRKIAAERRGTTAPSVTVSGGAANDNNPSTVTAVDVKPTATVDTNCQDDEALFKDVDDVSREGVSELTDVGGVGSTSAALSSQRDRDKTVTSSTLVQFSEKIADDWLKLARKLGFKMEDIEYIMGEHKDAVDQAKTMLQTWFGEDEDATLENFVYILEGLEMEEAAEVGRRELASVDAYMDT